MFQLSGVHCKLLRQRHPQLVVRSAHGEEAGLHVSDQAPNIEGLNSSNSYLYYFGGFLIIVIL